MTRRDPFDVALSLVCGLAREGGFTAAPMRNVSPPVEGFAVAIPGHGTAFPVQLLHPFMVTGWLEREAETLCLPGVYAGVWLDDASGLVYLDAVLVHETEAEALEVARLAGEVAVYDLGRRVEVFA